MHRRTCIILASFCIYTIAMQKSLFRAVKVPVLRRKRAYIATQNRLF